MLLAAVVGSGIMADRLAGGNQAIALLANTIATGAALIVLILTFGPISGAHFNPAVTVADASQGGPRVARRSRLRRCPDCRRGTWCVGSPSHVSRAGIHAVAARAKRAGTDVQRVRGYVWTSLGDLGLFASPFGCRSLCDWRVHHGGVLVHGVHFICESCPHVCAVVVRHICWHPPRRCSGCCRRSVRRRVRGNALVPVACSRAA